MANQNTKFKTNLFEDLRDEDLELVVGGFSGNHDGSVTLNGVGTVNLPVVEDNPVITVPTPFGNATYDDSKDALV